MPAESFYIDESLLIEFQNGSAAAFRRIFDGHYRRLLFFAQQILGDREQAEDIVADSFLKIWERRDEIKKDFALPAYLQAVVRNACFDQLKKDRRQRGILNELGSAELVSEDSINAGLVRAELLDRSWQLARELPPATRKVFELHYGDGLTLKEISSQLGVSVNTVKAQRQTALQRIRIVLKGKAWLLVLAWQMMH